MVTVLVWLKRGDCDCAYECCVSYKAGKMHVSYGGVLATNGAEDGAEISFIGDVPSFQRRCPKFSKGIINRLLICLALFRPL
jgi:hypothetical protein